MWKETKQHLTNFYQYVLCWQIGNAPKLVVQMSNAVVVLCFGKGLASYCKAETTFTFYFSILTLSNAFLGIDNREMKSESGFSFAIASQPLRCISKKSQKFHRIEKGLYDDILQMYCNTMTLII